MASDLVHVTVLEAVPIVVRVLDTFSTVGRALERPESRDAGRRGRHMSSHEFITTALFEVIRYQVPHVKP